MNRRPRLAGDKAGFQRRCKQDSQRLGCRPFAPARWRALGHRTGISPGPWKSIGRCHKTWRRRPVSWGISLSSGPRQPCSEQVLTLLEGEKLRGFGLCHPFQRRSLVSAWALGRGFGVRCLCPSRPCHRAAFHVGFHKTPKPGSCAPNSICAPKESGSWRPSGDEEFSMDRSPKQTLSCQTRSAGSTWSQHRSDSQNTNPSSPGVRPGASWWSAIFTICYTLSRPASATGGTFVTCRPRKVTCCARCPTTWRAKSLRCGLITYAPW